MQTIHKAFSLKKFKIENDEETNKKPNKTMKWTLITNEALLFSRAIKMQMFKKEKGNINHVIENEIIFKWSNEMGCKSH